MSEAGRLHLGRDRVADPVRGREHISQLRGQGFAGGRNAIGGEDRQTPNGGESTATRLVDESGDRRRSTSRRAPRFRASLSIAQVRGVAHQRADRLQAILGSLKERHAIESVQRPLHWRVDGRRRKEVAAGERHRQERDFGMVPNGAFEHVIRGRFTVEPRWERARIDDRVDRWVVGEQVQRALEQLGLEHALAGDIERIADVAELRHHLAQPVLGLVGEP